MGLRHNEVDKKKNFNHSLVEDKKQHDVGLMVRGENEKIPMGGDDAV